MADNYHLKSTSRQSAIVQDRELSQTSLTRRIIRPVIVDNPKNPEASVKVTILHQKANGRNDFEDIPTESLSTFKAKDIGKLALDSSETRKLYEELQNLYSIHSSKGVPRGEKDLVVGFEDEIIRTDVKRAAHIKKLLENGFSEEIWNALVSADPNLATRLGLARVHQTRNDALKQFEVMLSAAKQDENAWQKFFESNTWIFGYGLSYQFLRSVSAQPAYGGQTYTGSGTNKGDFLKSTPGLAKFTVLVEIKTPTSPLLEGKQYRNDVFVPGYELVGGVSQLRSNARTWEHEGAGLPKNRDSLEGNQVFTVRPRQILVIGDTCQLTTRAQRECFELFRRGKNDIEIITFDELLARTRHILSDI